MKQLATLALAALVGTAVPAWAEVTRDQAAAIAKRESGGRVLSVERAESDGRPVWRIKLVTAGGDVRVLLLDLASGKPV